MSGQQPPTATCRSEQYTNLVLIGGRDCIPGKPLNWQNPDLWVKGGAIIEKTLCVGGNIMTNEYLIGNTCADVLLVSDIKEKYLHEGINVYGDTTFHGNVNILGGTGETDPVFNTITVINDSRLHGNLVVDHTTTTKDLIVTHNGTVQGNLTVNEKTTTDELDVIRDVHVGGKIYAERLCVFGNTEFFGNVLFGGSMVAGVSSFSAGTTGLTPSTPVMGAVVLGGSINATHGGTGLSSYTTGDILYATSPSTIGRLPDVAVGNVLLSGGVGAAPTYGKVNLTTTVTGALPPTNGGTGLTAVPINGQIPIGNGTNFTLNTITAGTGISVANGAGTITVSNSGVTSFQTSLAGLTPSVATTGAVTLAGILGAASGGTGITTAAANGQLLIGTGTGFTLNNITAGSGISITNGSGTITIASTGTAGVSTWSAGTTGFSPSSATNGAVVLTGVLNAVNGGTGISSYVVGDLLFANSTTTISRLADVSAGLPLLSQGVGVAPAYGVINLTAGTGITGTLSPTNGGTGLTLTPANGQIPIGTGTGFSLNTITAGSGISISNGAGTITITSTGTAGVSTWSAGTTGFTPSVATAGAIVLGGTLAVTNGGTGVVSPATGSLLVGNGSSAMTVLNDVAIGNVLLSQGVGIAPAYGKVNLTTTVVGSLPPTNGGTGITTTPGNGQILIGTGTGFALNTITAGSGISITNGSGTITITSTGTAGVSTWSAGSTGFTPSIATAGVVTLGGTLAVTNGGTGVVSPTIGSLLIGNSASAMSVLPAGIIAYPLISQGPGISPQYAQLDLTAGVTNSLPPANGGTGLTATPTNGQIPIGTGTGFSLNTLTGSTGISIANTSGAITIINNGVVSFSAGTTGLTPSSATTGAVVLGGTLAVTNGGTGVVSPATGSLLVGNGSTAMTILNDVAIGNVLLSQGVGIAPAYGKVNLTTTVVGSLPPTNGGTGITTTPSNGQILIGNGTGFTLNPINTGTGISVVNGAGTITISNTGVTSFETSLAGLTPSVASTGAVTLAGTLGAASGGTGITTAPANGQILIGNGTSFTLNTITAGSGINISNGSGTISISSTGTSGVSTFSAGSTGFSPTSATAGAVVLSGVLNAASGGTGQSAYVVGDLLYANTTSSLARLADVATGSILVSGGVGVAPSWSNTLTLSGLTSNAFIFSGTGGQITSTAAPTNGQILVGMTGSPPQLVSVSGDITLSQTGLATVVSVNALPIRTSTGVNSSIFFGYSATFPTATQSIGIGYQALNTVTGTGNVALGYQAGSSIVTGTNNTLIGYQTSLLTNSLNNTVVIGTNAQATASNAVAIGQNVVANQAGGLFLQHRGPLSVVVNLAGFIAGTNELVELTSSRRFKQNIRDLEEVSDKFDMLRPVRFNPNPGYGELGSEHIGLIAEEVEELFPEFITHDREGLTTGMMYDRMISILIKEIQANKREIRALKSHLQL